MWAQSPRLLSWTEGWGLGLDLPWAAPLEASVSSPLPVPLPLVLCLSVCLSVSASRRALAPWLCPAAQISAKERVIRDTHDPGETLRVPAATPREVPGDFSPPFSTSTSRSSSLALWPKTLRNFLRKPKCFLFGAGYAETSPGRGARQGWRLMFLEVASGGGAAPGRLRVGRRGCDPLRSSTAATFSRSDPGPDWPERSPVMTPDGSPSSRQGPRPPASIRGHRVGSPCDRNGVSCPELGAGFDHQVLTHTIPEPRPSPASGAAL